jgi:hypothetical protein
MARRYPKDASRLNIKVLSFVLFFGDGRLMRSVSFVRTQPPENAMTQRSLHLPKTYASYRRYYP